MCQKKEFFIFSEYCIHLYSLEQPPSLGSGLNDGQWHAVRLVAKENFAMLTVDGEETSAVRSTSPLSINTGGTYHLGGKAHFIIVNVNILLYLHLPFLKACSLWLPTSKLQLLM